MTKIPFLQFALKIPRYIKKQNLKVVWNKKKDQKRRPKFEKDLHIHHWQRGWYEEKILGLPILTIQMRIRWKTPKMTGKNKATIFRATGSKQGILFPDKFLSGVKKTDSETASKTYQLHILSQKSYCKTYWD